MTETLHCHGREQPDEERWRKNEKREAEAQGMRSGLQQQIKRNGDNL